MKKYRNIELHVMNMKTKQEEEYFLDYSTKTLKKNNVISPTVKKITNKLLNTVKEEVNKIIKQNPELQLQEVVVNQKYFSKNNNLIVEPIRKII